MIGMNFYFAGRSLIAACILYVQRDKTMYGMVDGGGGLHKHEIDTML